MLPRALDPFQPQPAALAAEAVLSPTTDNIPAAPQPWFPYERHTWTWRGYRTSYYVAGCGSPVILVHGFGANAKHWRRTMPELARHHKVYAIDLLGFGDSEKPGDRGFQFTTEVWADQVLDFAKEFVGSAPVVLVGNSIGSLTCIIANARAQQVRGCCFSGTYVAAHRCMMCHEGTNICMCVRHPLSSSCHISVILMRMPLTVAPAPTSPGGRNGAWHGAAQHGGCDEQQGYRRGLARHPRAPSHLPH